MAALTRAELVEHVDRELGARMRRYAMRFARSPEDAEDAYQAALLRLWRWGPTDTLEHATAWFCVVLRNEVGRLYRPRVGAPKVVGHLGEQAARVPDPGPGPEELVLQHERIASLRKVNPDWLRPLYARGLGLAHEEISEATGLSRRQIRKRITKARQAARELEAA